MAYIRVNASPEREKKIQEVLPVAPLTQTILMPALEQLQEPLLQMLRAEIEIYKAFPKENGTFDLEQFNPRNHKTCFLGLGFFSTGQGEWQDADLVRYRRGVGTLHHPVWGNAVTLLEIWGGDHFEKYPDMVKGVYAYCYDQGPLPKLFFRANPFIVTENTGTFYLDEEDEAEQRLQQTAAENELRRQHGLPFQNYTAEEIESYRKADNWSEEHRCPKDEIPRGKRRPRWNDDEDDE